MKPTRMMLSAALALSALALASSGARAQVDPKSIMLIPKDQIQWTGDKVKVAVLYGDPKKEGSVYVELLRWPPNWSTRPHSHPHDRMITVLEGTLYVGTGAKFHPETNTPVKPGGFLVDNADQIHYEVTKDDGALIEIVGVGADTMVKREEQ
jgi:quercetin dioxygenase-like cupin family protein